MDYKKAYEGALERAKKAVKEGMISQSFVDEIFGVKESEDEKIKKQLINEVREQIENIPASDCCDSDDLQRLTVLQSWLAYLEKQKEQKDYRKLYEDIAQSEWFKKAHVGKSLGEEDAQKEQKPVQDREEREYVRTLKSLIVDFLRDKECVNRGYYQDIYDWLDGRHIEQQPKQEWSEEDEKMLDAIIDAIPEDFAASDYKEMVTWLKSLRPKPHWKPSKEQMFALNDAVFDHIASCEKTANILESLYNDLQKLL